VADVIAPPGLRVGRYALALARPLTVGPATVSLREGALLRAPDGRLADLCPLPGLSPASLDEELAALAADAPLAAGSWALWALEHAPIAAEDLGQDLGVASALLVDGELPATAGDAPPVLKVKVGRRALDVEAAWIADLAAAGHMLRLDGNRRLTPDAARALAAAAGPRLAFLEEPVPPAATAALADVLPLALDETLTEISDPAALPPAAAWVLKPTLLGAALTETLVEAAARRGLPIVVSSCFESAVGRLALARAARTWAPDVAHGLGTAGWLQADFTTSADVERLTFTRLGEAHT
jgi:hypothetical protein